jgi:hypothetical protein
VTSSLDDLLDVGEQLPEEIPAGRLPGGGWRWTIRTLLVAAGGTLVGGLLMRIISEHTVPWLLFFVGLVVVQVLFAVLVWVRNPQLPQTLRFGIASTQRASEMAERDGLALASQRWYRNLAWFGLQGGNNGEQYARTLQPRLARLVEERLRLRHGVSLRGDPARARQLIGEQLWSLVSAPAKRSPSPRELEALVKQMEAI